MYFSFFVKNRFHRSLLYNIDPVTHSWAVRSGDFKLITDNALDNEFSGWYPTVESANLTRTVKCGSKTNLCEGSEKPCLFNLADDPCEQNDIFEERPDIVKVCSENFFLTIVSEECLSRCSDEIRLKQKKSGIETKKMAIAEADGQARRIPDYHASHRKQTQDSRG